MTEEQHYAEAVGRNLAYLRGLVKDWIAEAERPKKDKRIPEKEYVKTGVTYKKVRSTPAPKKVRITGQQIYDRLDKGETSAQIAAAESLNVSTINNILRDAKLKHPPRHCVDCGRKYNYTAGLS